MGTFLEILFTAVITFIAGFLSLKYRPKTKKKLKNSKFNSLKNSRFMLLIMVCTMVSFTLFYLLGKGYVIVEW